MPDLEYEPKRRRRRPSVWLRLTYAVVILFFVIPVAYVVLMIFLLLLYGVDNF